MKLLLILLTLVSPTIARAQTSIVVDVVMLKNGTKLTGTILSDVKKKPLKIRTTDGETHTVKRAMIKSISKETLAVEAPPPPADTSSKVGAAKVDAAPPMASTVSKQSDSYAPIQKFRFGPVSSMPLGDFSTASDPGAGVMAEYSYEIANNFSLDGRLGYLYWFGKNLSTENVASYIDVSSVVLGAGGRYAITSNFSVYGLLSFYFLSESGKLSAPDPISGVQDTIATGGSATKVGFTPGAEYNFDFRLFGLVPGFAAELNFIQGGFTNFAIAFLLSTTF